MPRRLRGRVPGRVCALYRAGCDPTYNRRAVRRGVLIFAVGLASLSGAPRVALAAPDLSLHPAPDGSLTLVGNGWRPGQRLVVTLGPTRIAALADSTGSFEVPTGLGSYQGGLTVHRQNATALARLDPALQPYVPDPLTVLFVRSLALGTALLTLFAASLGVAVIAARSLRILR